MAGQMTALPFERLNRIRMHLCNGVAESVVDTMGVDESLVRGVDGGFKPSPNGTGSASPPKEAM